jgi:hypothetical protein
LRFEAIFALDKMSVVDIFDDGVLSDFHDFDQPGRWGLFFYVRLWQSENTRKSGWVRNLTSCRMHKTGVYRARGSSFCFGRVSKRTSSRRIGSEPSIHTN